MNALYDHSQHGGLPPFDRLDAAQVRPAIGRILEELTVGQRSIEADVQPTWASAVEAVGDLVEPLERAWGAGTHLVGVKNSPELREAHQAIQPAVVEASLKLAQSEPLFRALSTLRTGPGFAS